MARTAQVPVCVWQDAAGSYTAALVQDFENAAAVGDTAEEALRQVKDFAQWASDEQAWRVETELDEVKLIEVKVSVRPEFRTGDRKVSGERPVVLRVPCVWARDEHRGLVGSLPTLGVHFEFGEASAVRELAAHYAQSAVQGLGPGDLAARAGVRHADLRWITVRVTGSERPAPRPLEEAFPALTAVAEPVLGGRGLQARVGTAWERGELADRLVARLREGKANLLLVGDPGVGKTTVLVEALRRLGREPEGGADRPSESGGNRLRFWMTSAARLIAGMQFLGQWEGRCEKAIEELAEVGGLLCAESLLDLVRLGGGGGGDSVAAFLAPYLARGELRLIAEARTEELDACRRLLPGLVDAFELMTVAPLEDAQVLQALRRLTSADASARRVEVAPGVVEVAARMIQRFQPGESPLGPTAVFLRQLLERTAREATPRLDPPAVWRAFTRQSGLPEDLLRDDRILPHASVRAHLEGRIVGQPDACEAAAAVVTRLKAGLNDPTRPVASLLFCGPTGVGKTALAHALAGFLFGQGETASERLVRLDMSEMGGPTAADRFLQRPDGQPADWVGRVRRQPFCVLLLDEIEKAAAEVFDLLLGLLDEGRLTDRLGRITSFRSAVVILTSNLGARWQAGMGFGEDAGPSYEAEAMRFFRPEFFNRLDAVVTFHPLDAGSMRGIARLELEAAARREGVARAGLNLSWTEAVEAHLARVGFDRRYGARPLQRAVERHFVRPLAEYLLGRGGRRGTAVRADMMDGRVVFEEIASGPERGGRGL